MPTPLALPLLVTVATLGRSPPPFVVTAVDAASESIGITVTVGEVTAFRGASAGLLIRHSVSWTVATMEVAVTGAEEWLFRLLENVANPPVGYLESEVTLASIFLACLTSFSASETTEPLKAFHFGSF